MIVNPQAESAVAAGLFQSSRMADELLGVIPADAILNEEIAQMFEAVAQLRAARMPIDVLTVFQHTRGRLPMDRLTGYHRQAREMHRESFLYHARQIVECWRMRKLIAAAKQIVIDANGHLDAAELAQRAVKTITEAIAQDHGGQLVSIGESAVQVWEQIQTGVQPGIPTGYKDIDELTGGWHAGDLNLIAARPGCGKTAFALNAAERVAATGVPVFFSSMEMAHDQLTGRLLAKLSGIDGQAIRLRSVPSASLPAVAQAVSQMLELPITVYDRAALTLSDLRQRATLWRDQHSGPALLMVDYLQLMRGEERRKDQRHLEVGEISQGLKALARELDVPLIALSQLSRAIEGRTGHTPLLSDLRESGSLEQDADMVMFIHREELYDRDTDKKGVAELIIAKQRAGPLGVIPLRFDATTTTFYDISFRTIEGY